MQYEDKGFNQEVYQLDDNKSESVVSSMYDLIQELHSTIDEVLSFTAQDYKQSFVIEIEDSKSVNEVLDEYFYFIHRAEIIDFKIYYIDVNRILLYFQNKEDAALFKTRFLLGN